MIGSESVAAPSHEALRLINGPDKSVDEISNVQNFVYTDTEGRMI